jgi:hypothetical protein
LLAAGSISRQQFRNMVVDDADHVEAVGHDLPLARVGQCRMDAE